MVNKVKMLAIGGIVLMEGFAMLFNLNGETLIYAVGAIAALGGAETLEVMRK